MKLLPIGKLSARTGCKIPTIRYYEEAGLIQRSYRTDSNHRRYSREHLQRLQFIMHSRELGFTLEDIRELIELSDNAQKGHEADRIAAKHLQNIELKINRLNALSDELRNMLDACTQDSKDHCRVIETLFDHSLCKREHWVVDK